MADATPQNYANHSRTDLFGFTLMGLSALNVLLLLAGLIVPQLLHAGIILMAILLLLAQLKARYYGLTVQDRVIRLEMRLRLERVLPDGLREPARDLPRGQLIALRFASDAELPSLVQKVLAGEIVTSDAIKRAVSDWQADTLRV